MIHYYFGNGKGKTSAAVGALLRAAGSGMRCVTVQFFKNGMSSEITLLRDCGIDVYACTFQGVRFFKKMTQTEREQVICDHNQNLERVIEHKYQFIVLDELGDAVQKNAVDSELVGRVLSISDTEIIITGHSRSEHFMKMADYITEFRCIAHPYQKGMTARKGIEY